MNDIVSFVNDNILNNKGVLLYLTEYGSKLYGTNTEKSDVDVKGIFISPPEMHWLGKAKDHFTYTSGNNNSGNTKDDIDIELYSVQKFISLLAKGETGAFDLLFSMFRKDTVLHQDENFVELLQDAKDIFITKNTKAFVGYCIQQAKKYGVKGSRYGELLKLKEQMELYRMSPLENFITDFDENEFNYCKVIYKNEMTFLSILGKLAPSSMIVDEVIDNRISGQIKSYGHRARAALESVDYKALSHAFRVLGEMEELAINKMITFPLKDAKFLKDIKAEKYSLDELIPMIEGRLEMLEALYNESKLPEKVDYEDVDLLLEGILEQRYNVWY